MGIYRRCDNDELIELGFEYAMEQDRMGYVTLPDGVQAKRCVGLEIGQEKAKAIHCGIDRFDLSFSLGFPDYQLDEMRSAAQSAGLTGVEFYPDPKASGMVGIRCSSEAEKERYIKHRGHYNQSGRNGGRLGKEDIDMARKLVKDRYG